MAFYTALFALCGVVMTVVGQPAAPPPPPTITGPCPAYTPVSTLDSAKMAGLFYVVSETRGGFGPHDPKESTKCLTMNFTPNPDKSLNYKWSLVAPDNKKHEGDVTGKLIAGKNTKLEILIGNTTSVMTFLEADPTTYAAYVICESDGKTHRYTVEVASRQKTIAPAILDKVKTTLTANKITSTVHTIAQTC